MQTSIYYFSATGNSLYAAQRIANKLGDCYLAPIAAMREEPMIIPETENVGLVFPMHYFGVPPLVKQFVAKLDLSKTRYIFSVTTCGNQSFGSAIHELKKLLAQKDRVLHAGFYVAMVDSYIPMFTMPSKEKQQQILANADEKIDLIAEQVKDRQLSMDKEYFWLACRPIHHYWLKRFDKIDLKFSNSDLCISCGQCSKACSVENIAMVDGRPEWQHHCQECLACLHICPVKSIEFGRTKGKARYHHPQLSWQEIIAAHFK